MLQLQVLWWSGQCLGCVVGQPRGCVARGPSVYLASCVPRATCSWDSPHLTAASTSNSTHQPPQTAWTQPHTTHTSQDTTPTIYHPPRASTTTPDSTTQLPDGEPSWPPWPTLPPGLLFLGPVYRMDSIPPTSHCLSMSLDIYMASVWGPQGVSDTV